MPLTKDEIVSQMKELASDLGRSDLDRFTYEELESTIVGVTADLRHLRSKFTENVNEEMRAKGYHV